MGGLTSGALRRQVHCRVTVRTARRGAGRLYSADHAIHVSHVGVRRHHENHPREGLRGHRTGAANGDGIRPPPKPAKKGSSCALPSNDRHRRGRPRRSTRRPSRGPRQDATPARRESSLSIERARNSCDATCRADSRSVPTRLRRSRGDRPRGCRLRRFGHSPVRRSLRGSRSAAARLRSAHRARLRLAGVPAALPCAVRSARQRARAAMLDLLAQTAHQVHADQPALSVTTRLIDGSPGAVLVDASREAQLLVVAHRGLGRVRRAPGRLSGCPDRRAFPLPGRGRARRLPTRWRAGRAGHRRFTRGQQGGRGRLRASATARRRADPGPSSAGTHKLRGYDRDRQPRVLGYRGRS